MTNDTTTLNGALQELGETMAANLVAQGVTGASASDGLTTLAAKILDIQTGSSCYHIEFSESSYAATGGSATLELTLQQNYEPLANATVTVTGSDSSLYTGITNSAGKAEITVSVSSTTTFTCSYSNVSDTCTVIVSTFIYSSDMTSDDGNWVRTGGSATITYNSSGLLVEGTNNTDTYYLIDETKVTIPHQDIVVEFNIVATADGKYSDSTQFCVYDTMIHSRNRKLTVTNLANTQYAQMTMPSYPIAVKMECGDTDTLVYVNNSLFATVPNTTWVGVGFKTYSQRSMTVKNVEIGNL